MGIFDFFKSKPSTAVAKRDASTVLTGALGGFAGQSQPFQGATARLKKSWYSKYLNDPDSKNYREIWQLRSLSRDLCRTDEHCNKYLSLLGDFVIGERGINLVPSIKDKTGTLLPDVNTSIKKAWTKWSESVTVNGDLTLDDLARYALIWLARDGEVIIQFAQNADLVLNVIDAHLINWERSGKSPTTPANMVIQGVEFVGTSMQIAGYWLYNRDKSSISNPVPLKEYFLPIADCLLVRRLDDINAVHSIPWITPAIVSIATLQEYDDTYMQACQVAASAPFWIENTEPSSADNIPIEDDDNPSNDQTNQADEEPFINFPHSVALNVPYGKKLNAFNLAFPNQNVAEFRKQIQHRIATGLKIQYSTLTSDNSDSNYAGSRYGSIPERTHWNNISVWFGKTLYNRIYREWLKRALATGKLKLPTSNPADYFDVQWRSTGIENGDGLKAAQEMLILRDNFIITNEEWCTEVGSNTFAENVAVAKAEKALLDAAGLTPATPKAQAGPADETGAVATSPDTTTDEQTGDEKPVVDPSDDQEPVNEQ